MNLSLSVSPFGVLGVLAFTGIVAWWAYYKLPIPLSNRIRYSLVSLRWIGLFLLFLLLLEPLLTAIFQEKHPPLVVLLQDNSKSMTASPDSNFLRQELPKQIQQFQEKLKEQNIQTVLLKFGKEVKPLHPDSLQFDASATNLSNALQYVADRFHNQNVAAISYISDGIPTEGSNPIYDIDKIPIPIFTYLAGDTVQRKDVLISAAIYNEITFVDAETPIRTTITAKGIQQEIVKINLKHQNTVIETQTVTLSSANSQRDLDWSVKPKEPGLMMYEVEIEPIQNEISYHNNRRKLFIQVQDTRIQVGIIAGGPHPDLGAFYKAFANTAQFQMKEFIRKSNNEFYTQPTQNELKELDLVILYNFPSIPADREILEAVYQEVTHRNIPLWHIYGSQTRFNISNRQPEFAALTPQNYTESFSDAFLYFDDRYQMHATYTFDESFLKWIKSSPPLLRNNSDWKMNGPTEIYGKAKIKNVALDYPILAFQDFRGRKNVVMIGENWWRYRMNCFLETNSFDQFDTWIQNIAQWLTTRQDKRKFRVVPAKNLFSGDDPIIFRGELYDDTYKPIHDAEIKLTLIDASGKKQPYFLTQSNQSYSVEIPALPAGTYSYEATATKNNIQLGKDQGRFSVGSYEPEFLELRADASLMRQIAIRSGGQAFHLRELSQSTNAILQLPHLKPAISTKSQTRGLQRYIWPMIVILIAFSAEWIIRKRFGLL